VYKDDHHGTPKSCKASNVRQTSNMSEAGLSEAERCGSAEDKPISFGIELGKPQSIPSHSTVLCDTE
jgi:hypothetical protein